MQVYDFAHLLCIVVICFLCGLVKLVIYLAFFCIVVSTKWSTEEKERKEILHLALEARVNERNESSHLSFSPPLFSSTLT